MTSANLQRVALLSALLALPALPAAAQTPPAGGGAASGRQATPPAKKKTDTSKYSELDSLVKVHRAAQVKMVKLWKQIKAGQNDEKTHDAYKAAQIDAQKASNEVTKYINREGWSAEDRAAMNKMWSEALEKPID